MKKILPFILALCLCIGLCACNAKSENGNDILTNSQANAVEKCAKLHAALDYGYELDSITHETAENDGSYITITGVVYFKDSEGVKYHGNYTVVLTEGESEDGYIVKSWELDKLLTEDGESVDWYEKLYKYVVQKGEYDSSSKVSYIYTKGSAVNEELFLIAENHTLHYCYSTNYKTSSTNFSIFYDCWFEKNKLPRFEMQYLNVDQYYNGVAIGGESAKVAGNYIDGLGVYASFNSEEYSGCQSNEIADAMYDCHTVGVEFIEDIMSEAQIPGTFEELFEQYILCD